MKTPRTLAEKVARLEAEAGELGQLHMQLTQAKAVARRQRLGVRAIGKTLTKLHGIVRQRQRKLDAIRAAVADVA